MSDHSTIRPPGAGLTFLRRVAGGPEESLYLAQANDGSVVFVKRAEFAYRYDKNRRRAFENEWELARRFDHPGLPRFLALDEIDGELMHIIHAPRCISLARVFNLCRARSERIPRAIGFRIAAQLASTVAYLQNLVFDSYSPGYPLHIALRPESLFLTDQGQCQLCLVSLQQPPSLVGAILQQEDQPYLLYSSPEQCVGGLDPDYRADLYTLGIVTYELLTSKALFSIGGAIDEALISRRKLRCLHALLSDVDPQLEPLDGLVTGLLQPLPCDRSSDLTTIADALVKTAGTLGRPATDAEIGDFIKEKLTEENHPVGLNTADAEFQKPTILTDIAEYNDS